MSGFFGFLDAVWCKVCMVRLLVFFIIYGVAMCCYSWVSDAFDVERGCLAFVEVFSVFLFSEFLQGGVRDCGVRFCFL